MASLEWWPEENCIPEVSLLHPTPTFKSGFCLVPLAGSFSPLILVVLRTFSVDFLILLCPFFPLKEEKSLTSLIPVYRAIKSFQIILVFSMPFTSTNFPTHAEIPQEKSQHGGEEAHVEMSCLKPVNQWLRGVGTEHMTPVPGACSK